MCAKSQSEPAVVVAARGGDQLGWGHVMRGLSLSELVPTTGPRHWVGGQGPTPSFLPLDGVLQHQIQPEAWLSVSQEPAIWIVDIPGSTLELEQKLKEAGHWVVRIDDLVRRPTVAHSIVCHHPFVLPDDIDPPTGTQLFHGPEFALVRRSFREQMLATPFHSSTPLSYAVVCIGGADPEGLLWKVAESLMVATDLEVKLIVGTAQQQVSANEVARLQTGHSASQITALRSLNEQAMASLLAQAAFAIVPGSTVALEALCVGTPLIIGHFMADQKAFAEYVDRPGFGVNIGDLRDFSSDTLTRALARIQTLPRPLPRLQSRHHELTAYFAEALAELSL
jgi:spore coat polysaccharide biosynthesis predicted glycosyltransferase SpsG